MHAALLAKRLHGLNRDAAYKAVLEVLKDIAPAKAATVPFTEPEPPFPGAPPPPPPVPTPTQTFPATPLEVDRQGYVDCKPVFAAFAGLFVEGADKRILLIEAQGEHGKSELLRRLVKHVRKHLGDTAAAKVEFKKPNRGPEELLWDVSQAWGVAEASGSDAIRKVEALLDSVKHRPTVLFLDVYDEAEEPNRHWVQRVLERCERDTSLRVVIAGREVPPLAGDWQDHAVKEQCRPFDSPDCIWEHAMSLGFKGSRDNITTLIEFCRVGQFSPKALLTNLQVLSQGGGSRT